MYDCRQGELSGSYGSWVYTVVEVGGLVELPTQKGGFNLVYNTAIYGTTY